jgi:hypothetical protein
MPYYSLTDGFAGLNAGIKSLGASLQNGYEQQYRQAVGSKMAAGDYDGAAQLAYTHGDIQTAQGIQQFQQQKQSNDLLNAGLGGMLGNRASPPGASPAAVLQAQGGLSASLAPQGSNPIAPPAPAPPAPAGPRGSDGAAAALGISPLAPRTAQYFQQNGVVGNPLGAAALAAGFQAESGYNPSATAKGDGRDESSAVNIGQWNGSRAVDFRNFYTANKLDASDPQTGLAFAKYELQNKPEYTSVVSALNSATSPEEANAAALGYWSPKGYTKSNPQGAADWDRRLAYTRAILGSLAQAASAPPQGGPGASPPQAGAMPPSAPGARIGLDGQPVGFNPTVGSDTSPLRSAPVQAQPGSSAPPDPPVAINGKPWTRESAAEDDSEESPSVADVARAQGIPWVGGEGDDDEGHVDPSWRPAGGVPPGASAPPAAPGGATPQQQAAMRQLPPAAARSVATTIATTLPGSTDRLNQLLRLQMLAGMAKNQGASDALKTMIEIEKGKVTPTDTMKGYALQIQQEQAQQQADIAAGRQPKPLTPYVDFISKERTPQGQTELEYALKSWKRLGFPNPSTIDADPAARRFWSIASQKALGMLPPGPAAAVTGNRPGASPVLGAAPARPYSGGSSISPMPQFADPSNPGYVRLKPDDPYIDGQVRQ